MRRYSRSAPLSSSNRNFSCSAAQRGGYATGGALGPWVTGALFDVTQSYQLGFSVIVVLIAASLAAILFVRLPERAAH